ncbi:MAG TPA: FtsX-like permease family protein, partial [Myxococcota bacterium]|nr:FtsX-like permease family protein [Myxococcota bacterium]
GLGIWVLTLVVALGFGARELILKEVVRELPVDTVEVVPRTLDLGLFKVGTSALFGAQPLDAAALARLQGLPGVAQASPRLDVGLPLGAQGGARFFGRRLYTDLFMTAVPPELVREEVGPAFTDTPDVIPVLISDQLVDIYNASVAPGLGTPQLTPEALTGFEFEIVVGRSLMLGSRGARTAGVERARIVGVSRYAMRLGVTVPLQTGRRLLAQYADHDEGERYSAVLLKAQSAAEVPTVAAGVEALGYGIDHTAQKTRRILTAATALAGGVGLLVLLLASLNIAHSFFAQLSERRRELGILRAVGARQLDVVALVVWQAAVLGLAGGVAGVGAARLVALAVDASVRTFLPNFPFRPESFFVFPWQLYAGSLLAAVVATSLGALWPALAAARMPVARSLAD